MVPHLFLARTGTCEYDWFCLFCVEYLTLGNIKIKEVYLVHSSGGWEVQTAWCWHPGKDPLAVSQYSREVGREIASVQALGTALLYNNPF
jgi:hypothetical protein